MREYAVIFDVDGVLVDSYAPHHESWKRIAESLSFDFTAEVFHKTFGRTSREIIEGLWGDRLSPQRIAELDIEKERVYREIIAESFPAMPGAVELIQSLCDHGIKVALGSSGPKENVETSIKGLKIASYLSTVVHGSEVKQGKPAPDIFLLAAERLGLTSQDCVVIEDSPFGIAAAKAARMQVIGFMSTGHRLEEYTQADRIVRSLAEIRPQDIIQILNPENSGKGIQKHAQTG